MNDEAYKEVYEKALEEGDTELLELLFKLKNSDPELVKTKETNGVNVKAIAEYFKEE